MAAEDSGEGPHPDSAWMPHEPAVPEPTKVAAAEESVPGYTDLVEIGRGGDSVVYRARDERLHREVAIKVLLVDDPATVSRFEREVEITVGLGRQHPNIMTVLAIGTTASGHPAIVMDYYERGSLDHRLYAEGPIATPEVVVIGTVLADALAFAHGHGVLHRDVKPQNVMVLPTSYVLGDFGIARLADSEHTASAERFTYRHASPQILDGHPPTVADDVWSLGSTLFTLLDGRPPFASDDPDDDTALAYLRRARTEPHRPLPVTDVNAGLVEVIERALRKDPAERWPDAARMRDALEDLRASLRAWAPESAPESGPDRPAPEQVDDQRPPVLTEKTRKRPPAAAPPTTEPPSRPEPTSERSVVPSAEEPHAGPAEASDDAPAEPDPVALSVLSHEPATAAEPARDAEPTARGIDGAGERNPESEILPGVDERRPPKRRIVLVLGIVAAVVGATLGIVGQMLRDDDSDAPAGRRETSDLPSLDLGESDTVQPPKFNRAISPVLTELDDRGTEVALSWADKTSGEARFQVIQTRPARAIVGLLLDPGTTSYTITGVDPSAKDLCYTVVAVNADGEQGAAKEPLCRR